jgi:hypothetical protein
MASYQLSFNQLDLLQQAALAQPSLLDSIEVQGTFAMKRFERVSCQRF